MSLESGDELAIDSNKDSSSRSNRNDEVRMKKPTSNSSVNRESQYQPNVQLDLST